VRQLLVYILIPVLAIIGIIYPFYGLCSYMVINILRPEMFFWGGHTGNILFNVTIGSTLLGFIAVLVGIRTAPLNNLRYLSGCREFWLLLWIWIATVVTLLLTSYPLHPRSWYYSNELLKLFILGALTLALVVSKEHIYRFQHIVMTAVTLLSIWGIEQRFRGNERLEGLGGSAFGDSNGVAAFGVLYLPIALNMFLTVNKTKEKLLWLFSFVVIALLVILTQSRGGLLGLIAALLYLLLRTRRKGMLLLFAGLAALIFTFTSLQTGDTFKRFEQFASGEELDYSGASRIVLWKAGLLIFKDHPFIGVGLLNFADAKAPYRYALADSEDPALLDYSFAGYKVGHGTFFAQIMPEGGLLLTIPYLWLIIQLFIGAYRMRKTNRHLSDPNLHDLLVGLQAGVVGNCVCNIFINNLFMYFLPIQILIGGQIIRQLQQHVNPQ